MIIRSSTLHSLSLGTLLTLALATLLSGCVGSDLHASGNAAPPDRNTGVVTAAHSNVAPAHPTPTYVPTGQPLQAFEQVLPPAPPAAALAPVHTTVTMQGTDPRAEASTAPQAAAAQLALPSAAAATPVPSRPDDALVQPASDPESESASNLRRKPVQQGADQEDDGKQAGDWKDDAKRGKGADKGADQEDDGKQAGDRKDDAKRGKGADKGQPSKNQRRP